MAELRERAAQLSIVDAHRLRRRLSSDRRGRAPRRPDLDRIAADITAAEARLAARAASVPTVSYPQDLPVSQRRQDLLDAIANHQVVVVAGETGSGKTTQLPKICLELGRGVRGMIGHTQPRRIAARSVAERIAQEVGSEIGATVGYAVRFTDKVGDDTLVKVMTDGILLAEIQRDRMLRRYDTIIIDEAHERSLNVDFLLGYLQQLLPRRPDLKLVITSATIDPQRFSRYFGGAPIIEVSGRGYPVEIRYRPVSDPDRPDAEDSDPIAAICDAVTELNREPAGDTLVFLSGEREIRDAADALNAMALRNTEILPLYARLSTSEQYRVFSPHTGRRVVLATNVAETSLTVPGIKYVIDAGTARISRYSNRTKVQLLPIEPISQASARQRAGRCGRTSDGICIRLYSEADYESRPAFTDPEIQRTNLASVILQMASLDLGPIEKFGFIDPPDRRQIADGVALLRELTALSGSDEAGPTLTPLGRQIAQLPVDPRLARMILEADRRDCVRDVLVLAAALSIQDPRERPAEHQQAADTHHARFADKLSDFSGYLNLWRYVREQQRALSSSQFRRMCRSEFLNYLRIREWQDLFTQLRQIAKSMGIVVGDGDGDPEQIHRSLLSGLLSHIGLKEGPRGDYLGARGAKFAVFPGSALFRKQPSFLMAAELVETSRLWGRTVAAIDSAWAEELAPDLVRRNYSEPHWERRRGGAVALERVTLYGVPLVTDRPIALDRIDAPLARELFVRHALVEGDWETRHHFFRDNRRLLDQLRDLEDRARRRDILVDDDTVFAFYDSRVPAEVVSSRHFDAWWKKARHLTPDLLTLTEADLVRGTGEVSPDQFPDRWTSGEFAVELSYQFEPGTATDGVSVDIPLALLNDERATALSWQVPGLRAELVTALIRSLPKPLRRQLVPVPDTATAVLAELPDEPGPDLGTVTEAISTVLRRVRGIDIPVDAWQLDALPGHLRPNLRVIATDGSLLGQGRDLAELRARFAPTVARELSRVTSDLSRDGLTDWDFDELPRQIQRVSGGHTITGYPALVELGAGTATPTVAIRVLDNPVEQGEQMWSGTRRLLALTLPSPVKATRQLLDQRTRLVMSRSPHGSLDALLADCGLAAVELAMRSHDAPAWNREAFVALRAAVGADLISTAGRIVRAVAEIIAATQDAELALSEPVTSATARAVVAEERDHLRSLVFEGFVSRTDPAALLHLPRYLATITQRVTDARLAPGKDGLRAEPVHVVERDLVELRSKLAGRPGTGPGLDRIRWLVEELRVSVFAQRLGTAQPVSVKRIHAAMDELDPR